MRMILIDEYINFLIKNKLTPTQYLLLHLLYNNRVDLIKDYKAAFPLEEGSMIPKLEIKDLVDKGFLIKENKNYKLGKTLTEIFVTPIVAVDEIYDIYPAFVTSDQGVSIPLNSMDRQVFKELYIPKIMGSIREHKEVMKDIDYAVNNNLIKVGINKFVTSQQWKGFRKLRKSQTTTTPSIQDKNF